MTQSFESGQAIAAQSIQQLQNQFFNQVKNISNFFSKYEDDVYLGEVSPGRNRAIYLLGHLVSTHDSMMPLLGFGQKSFPEYEAFFTTSPDRSFEKIPSLGELKDAWEKVNKTLAAHFSQLKPEDWLLPHTRVSDADFAIDPLRNKLSILISRTGHISYHSGQLTFLVKREVTA